MTTQRYRIRPCAPGHVRTAIESLSTLRDEHRDQEWHEDAVAAKATAEELAGDYHYGVAICDTQQRTVDWGDEVTGYDDDPARGPMEGETR